jgi:carbamoylphosphate synthase small subunit
MLRYWQRFIRCVLTARYGKNMPIAHGDNATMQLKPFAIAATRVGSIEVTHDNAGWSIKCKASGWIVCSIKKDARHWRNIDTLIRQLKKAGYRGRLIVPVDTQQDLID